MAHCPNCKRDVVPSVSLGTSALGGTEKSVIASGAVRTCPECNAHLPEPAESYDVASPTIVRRAEPKAHPTLQASIERGVSLPAMIRARTKELRARIKADQRELAQLERLTSPARRASVTPIRKVAT